MAVVNISLDTQTRQVVLTINGILVPHTECSINKYVFDTEEGKEENISFSYTVENIDGTGLKEVRQFYLPSQEELATVAHAGLNENGLSSKIVHDDEKAKADVIDFIKQGRNSRQ
jgi:hypothetical protein